MLYIGTTNQQHPPKEEPMPSLTLREVVLVPCTSTIEHATLRHDACPTCAGSGQRPAAATETVWCEYGHPADLSFTPEGPVLDDWAPDREDTSSGDEAGCVQWDCPTPRCTSMVSLTTRRVR